jgi:hypothetical protein
VVRRALRPTRGVGIPSALSTAILGFPFATSEPQEK